MTSLQRIIDEGKEIINKDFGMSTEKTRLKQYNTNIWNIFCEINKFDKNSEGIYIPESNIAYVNKDKKHLVSNVYHEFFGHGIYCENSVIGKPLAQMSTKEEKGDYLFNQEIAKEQVFGITNNNFENYEGFALWIEKYLCEKTGNSSIWKSKKSLLPILHQELSEYFDYAEQKLTSFGLISQMGLPKHYTEEKLLNTILHISGDMYKDSTIILYGSKNPESDIDLFIISNNNSNNYFNGWLDIYELNKVDFTQYANLLDISVTDPLFSGKVIYGDRTYIEREKKRIKNMKITREAIEHNMQAAKSQEGMLQNIPKYTREYSIGDKYSKSYRLNAQILSRGISPLTYKVLKSFNHSP